MKNFQKTATGSPRVRSVLNIFFCKDISQVASLLDWRLKGVSLAIEVFMKPTINIYWGFPSLPLAVGITSANTFSASGQQSSGTLDFSAKIVFAGKGD